MPGCLLSCMSSTDSLCQRLPDRTSTSAGADLDPQEVLQALGEGMPLAVAAPTLERMLRERVHRMRQGTMLKHLHRAANLTTASQRAQVWLFVISHAMTDEEHLMGADKEGESLLCARSDWHIASFSTSCVLCSSCPNALLQLRNEPAASAMLAWAPGSLLHTPMAFWSASSVSARAHPISVQ